MNNTEEIMELSLSLWVSYYLCGPHEVQYFVQMF